LLSLNSHQPKKKLKDHQSTHTSFANLTIKIKVIKRDTGAGKKYPDEESYDRKTRKRLKNQSKSISVQENDWLLENKKTGSNQEKLFRETN
jgi:hypothetical protein